MDAEDLFVPASQNLKRMHALDDGEVLTAIEFRVRQPQQPRELPPARPGNSGQHRAAAGGEALPLRSSSSTRCATPSISRLPASPCSWTRRRPSRPSLRASRWARSRPRRIVPATPSRSWPATLLTDEVIHEAARAAVRGAEPLALNAYKVGLVQKLVTEALQELSA